jgi:hypothetical protein
MKAFFAFCIASTFAVAMEPQVITNRPHECCPALFGKGGIEPHLPTQTQAVQWVLRAANWEHATFTQFVCSKEQTADCDDIQEVVSIEKDLLKRMLVYNYYTNADAQTNALEILSRVLREIRTDNLNPVLITKKDWYHRLLAYVPWNGQRESGTCYPLLIKNRSKFLHTHEDGYSSMFWTSQIEYTCC